MGKFRFEIRNKVALSPADVKAAKNDQRPSGKQMLLCIQFFMLYVIEYSWLGLLVNCVFKNKRFGHNEKTQKKSIHEKSKV